MKKHKHGIEGEITYEKHGGPFHGSPKETHSFGHGGHLGGYKTKQIDINMNPGRAALKVKPDREGGHFEGGREYGKAKPSMRTRGREED